MWKSNPETHVYKTVGDCQIKADVHRPVTASAKTPVIVHIHGGCLMYGSRTDIATRQLDLYRNAGYAVVRIDYRLAPETKLPAIIEDLQDAFRWVMEKGPELFDIDPERIAVVGHSAGGYLALMAGCCVQPKPKAIVSIYGYGDLVGEWYSKPDPFHCEMPAVSEEESGRRVQGPVISEPYDGRGKDRLYVYCRQHGLWPFEVSGHDPETEPSFFGPYCPAQNVLADYPPTLLLHGDKDTDVPYALSVMMAEALADSSVEHQLITIQGGPHGFDANMDDPQVSAAFEEALAFLGRHV